MTKLVALKAPLPAGAFTLDSFLSFLFPLDAPTTCWPIGLGVNCRVLYSDVDTYSPYLVLEQQAWRTRELDGRAAILSKK